MSHITATVYVNVYICTLVALACNKACTCNLALLIGDLNKPGSLYRQMCFRLRPRLCHPSRRHTGTLLHAEAFHGLGLASRGVSRWGRQQLVMHSGITSCSTRVLADLVCCCCGSSCDLENNQEKMFLPGSQTTVQIALYKQNTPERFSVLVVAQRVQLQNCTC